ncbi:MAG: hypothetical protein M3Q97_01140 [Bacteroidota bacterium]|nr:hypothetical protein [Bacteroidota bacterium]
MGKIVFKRTPGFRFFMKGYWIRVNDNKIDKLFHYKAIELPEGEYKVEVQIEALYSKEINIHLRNGQTEVIFVKPLPGSGFLSVLSFLAFIGALLLYFSPSKEPWIYLLLMIPVLYMLYFFVYTKIKPFPIIQLQKR